MAFRIEVMRESDWPQVEEIYRGGIATRRATFETHTPSWEAWDANHRAAPRLVIRENAQIIGWAALSPASSRRVYAGVAEVSIYIKASARGQGAGRMLLGALAEESERAGFWTLQAGIFAENEASIALHAACGFRIVGCRERLGQLGGVWKDIILMERRSRIVGG